MANITNQNGSVVEINLKNFKTSSGCLPEANMNSTEIRAPPYLYLASVFRRVLWPQRLKTYCFPLPFQLQMVRQPVSICNGAVGVSWSFQNHSKEKRKNSHIKRSSALLQNCQIIKSKLLTLQTCTS